MKLLPPIQVHEEEWFPLDMRVATPHIIVNLGMNVDSVPAKEYTIEHGLLCMPLMDVITKPPGVALRFVYPNIGTVRVEGDVPFSAVARMFKRN